MKIEKRDIKDLDIFNPDINSENDLMIKFIDIQKKLPIFKVRYTYKTKRGNWKENYRYLFADDHDDAKFKFLEYIFDFNKKKPYRAISNVKILDVTHEGDLVK